MGEVLFTVTHKLNWQDGMCRDRALTATDFRVGYAIGMHVNKHTGIAIVGMETLALITDLHVSTVKRGIAALEREKHLKVLRRDLGFRKDGRKVSGGRVAHRYSPIIRSRPQMVSLASDDGEVSSSPVVSFSASERRPNNAGKETKFGELADHPRSAYPFKNPISYPKRGAERHKSPLMAAADRLIAELENPPRKTGDRLVELGRFEQLLAERLSIDHGTLIERVDGGVVVNLHRKFRCGVDINADITDLRVKLIAPLLVEDKRGAAS